MSATSRQPGETGMLIQAEATGAPPKIASPENIPGDLLDELWRAAKGSGVGLTSAEFEQVLMRVGAKNNFSLGPEVEATLAQRSSFYRGLQLEDLALAHACSLGRDTAWQIFMSRFREALRQAAVGITRSSSLGQELADSLYSELFGLTERDGQRRSPLTSYSGRGSLLGWLRTTLAQRYVDQHRRTHRESPIEDQEFAASEPTQAATPETLGRLAHSVSATLRELAPEDRFLLSAYFLDRRTLLQIAHLLRVHEATVSRRLKRLTENLHKQLLKHLQACGMSKRAAEEALGTDPRDIDLNLRSLLQASATASFLEQASPRSKLPDTKTHNRTESDTLKTDITKTDV